MKTPQSFYIVDDDTIFHYLTKRIIHEIYTQSKISSFLNGEEALAALSLALKLKQVMPDVIFLDIAMPIMDGWQFMDQYSLLQPELAQPITIYMVSSSIDRRDEARAGDIKHLSGYVVKPVTKAMFLTMIQNYAS